MAVCSCFRRPLFCALVALLLAGWIGLGPGQAQDKHQLGSDSVEGAFRFKINQDRFTKLINGEVPDAKDKALIQLGAKYYLYQLTWPTVQKEKGGEKTAATRVKTEFDNKMVEIASQLRKKEFLKLFAHELVVVFKEMLALDMRNYH